MAGLPTITVKLDDTSNGGTYPYDISQYVSLGRGQIQIVRGRQDEISTMQPSQLTATLDNIDGRFTLGTTGGGYGAINVDRRIQISETVGGTTSVRFTGYVQNWPTSWPTGSDQDALIVLTSTCRYARFARRILRSQTEQQIRANPTIAGYYTCGEAAGSTSAGNSATSTQDALTAMNSVTFGDPRGPVSDGGLTSISVTGNGWLQGTINDPTPRKQYVVGMFVTTSVVPSFSLTLAQITVPGAIGAASFFLNMDSTGHFVAQVGTDQGNISSATSASGGYANGVTHMVTAVFDSVAGTLSLYVDSNAAVTASVVVNNTVTFNGCLYFVGGSSTNSPFNFSGSIAHVFNGPSNMNVIGPGNCYVISNAGTGDAGYNALSAVEYAGMLPAETVIESAYQITMAGLDTTGMTLEAYLAASVLAEGGLAFIRGDGKAVWQNRYHRSQTSLNTVTLTVDAVDPATTVSTDMQQVVNYAYGTRFNGTAQVVAQSASSTANHEQYPSSLDGMACNTDAEMRDHCYWLVNTHAEPAARIPQLTIDMLTQTQAIQQAVMGLEISDRLKITGMPSQTPGGTTADLCIEGWTETITNTSWDITFNTTPYSLNNVWLLDDTTYSVEDSTTRLGF